MTSWGDLKGQVCVVTGAGGGIGRRICLDLASAGAHLMLIDASEGACAAIRQEVEALGAKCNSAVIDLTDRAAVERAAAMSLKNLGPCTGLINTIAISGRPDTLLDIDLAKWDRQIAVNLTSYLSTSQLFARQMRDARGGSIVHIGSLAGQMPQPNSGAYSVCKAGLAMMSRVLAAELGQYGIRSNVVSPALVRTPLSEKVYSDADLLARRKKMIPLGEISVPDHISQAALFLLSPRSCYVTGQDLLVDGGISQTLMGLFPRPASDSPKPA